MADMRKLERCDKRKAITNIPVLLRLLQSLTTVHLSSGEYIGLLDSRSSKGLAQLLALSSVRLQAFLPQPQRAIDKIDKSLSQSQLPSTPVYINIYGPMHFSDLTGRILSDNEIFLQHPKFNEKHLEYKNPHYFTGHTDDPHYFTGPSDASISESPARLLSTIEEEVKALFEVGVDSFFSEIEPGNEVKTRLLRYLCIQLTPCTIGWFGAV